jgi:chromosome segregation ATPase
VPLRSAGAEPRPPDPSREFSEKIEKLSREKSALESELSRLAQENALLRKRQESFRGVTAELDTKISRAREGYESAISRLEGQVRLLEEHLRGLQQDKAFLEKTCSRLEEDALSARQREARSNGELTEARRRLEQYDKELERLKLSDAANAATAAELRRQISQNRSEGRQP